MKPFFENLKQLFTSENLKKTFQETMSGDVLLRERVRAQMPFVGMICAMFVIYMFCNYRAQTQQRQISQLNKQLEDAHFEYLTLQAELVEQSRQSYILQRLQENGSNVTISNQPAIAID